MSKIDKKQLDEILKLKTDIKVLEKMNNKKTDLPIAQVGLVTATALGIGGLSMVTGLSIAIPVGIGITGIIGGVVGTMNKDKDQVALTKDIIDTEEWKSKILEKQVDKRDFLSASDIDLIKRARNLFDHVEIKNNFDDEPSYNDVIKNNRTFTFIYDVPFGLIDDDFEDKKNRISKLLGTTNVDMELKDGQLHIKYSVSCEFKNLYTYEPIYFPKTTNFHALVGMVEQNGEIKPYSFDFSEEPHMLLAGTTGKGKSTLLNCLIINLMLNYSPQELTMFLIDFKGGVEFACFENTKHTKEVIWEKDRLEKLLKAIEHNECPKREKLLKKKGSKNIFGYNEQVSEKDRLPFMLIVIDEFAQLSPSEDKEIIEQLMRLTPKTRFLGIYFIIATQRPSADIITNNIKGMLTNTVGLGVSTIHDTKVIFGENEVELEKIKGKGKGYLKTNGEYEYFQGFYLGIDPSDKSEQERVIAQILESNNLYK
ncbi:MAG: FtsK/SpoIIIE domain-containing protein [Paraclostridium sp.]